MAPGLFLGLLPVLFSVGHGPKRCRPGNYPHAISHTVFSPRRTFLIVNTNKALDKNGAPDGLSSNQFISRSHRSCSKAADTTQSVRILRIRLRSPGRRPAPRKRARRERGSGTGKPQANCRGRLDSIRPGEQCALGWADRGAWSSGMATNKAPIAVPDTENSGFTDRIHPYGAAIPAYSARSGFTTTPTRQSIRGVEESPRRLNHPAYADNQFVRAHHALELLNIQAVQPILSPAVFLTAGMGIHVGVFSKLFRRACHDSSDPRKLQSRRYWVADCRSCGVRSIIAKVDPDKKTFDMPSAGETFDSVCIHCGFTNTFSDYDVRTVVVKTPSVSAGPGSQEKDRSQPSRSRRVAAQAGSAGSSPYPRV